MRELPLLAITKLHDVEGLKKQYSNVGNLHHQIIIVVVIIFNRNSHLHLVFYLNTVLTFEYLLQSVNQSINQSKKINKIW